MAALLAVVAAGLSAAAALAIGWRWGVWRWLRLAMAVPALLVVARQPVGVAAALVLVGAAILVVCWQAPVSYAQVGLGAVLLVGGIVLAHLAAGSGIGSASVLVRCAFVFVLVLALAAGAGLARARLVGLRVVVVTSAAIPLVALAATSRVEMVLAWLPVCGVLAVTALLRGARGARASVPQVDDVDRAAAAEFRSRYGEPVLAPVAVVIAAYDEATGLPDVVRSIPATVCDLRADLVVVDDGSSDGTAEAARQAGAAYVVQCPANRGQGAALRLGYRIAREHGASYVITTDADGQYDVADLATVLAPILGGSADFVTGSRRLGRQPVQDPLRRLGVHVFAWLVSALCGRRLSDTSFGLRAMRAEVTATVTLNQPQYQSSELLIGTLSHGFRVAEVPGTMHVRAVGASKKGKNLVYGRRYARVVLGTWWREGCPTPVSSCPAVRGSRDHERPRMRTRSGAHPAA